MYFSFLQGRKSSIGIIIYTDDLKAASNLKNGATNSFVIFITAPSFFRNVDQTFPQETICTQYQSSKYCPDKSIYIEITNQ